jgi:hypothetical protein
MTKNKKFEKWAKIILLKVQKIVLVEDFTPVSLEYKKKLRHDAIAECECEYPYKTITINYSDELVEMFDKKKFRELTNILVHEMCHPITDPLYQKAIYRYIGSNEVEDERERLTDHIAGIVIKNKLI